MPQPAQDGEVPGSSGVTNKPAAAGAAPRAGTHEISSDEDEDGVVPVTRPQTQESVADVVKGQLAHNKGAERVSSKIDPALAQLMDKYMVESTHQVEFDKLTKKFPRPENVENMKTPRLDMEVFQVVEQHSKNVDQAMQSIQRGVLAAMSAVLPALTLMLQRKDDEELNVAGKDLLQGTQLLAFSANAISNKRRDFMKSQFSSLYARTMTKGQSSSDWLYGGDLGEVTKQCETMKKLGEKILKRKPPTFAPRGQQNKRFRAPFFLRAFNPFQFQQQTRFPNPQGYQNFGFPSPQQFQTPFPQAQQNFPSQWGGFQRFTRYSRQQMKRGQGFQKRGAYQK